MAFNGMTMDPKDRNSMMKTVTPTSNAAQGSVSSIASNWSTRSALEPPTRTSVPSGTSTLRTSATRSLASELCQSSS